MSSTNLHEMLMDPYMYYTHQWLSEAWKIKKTNKYFGET